MRWQWTLYLVLLASFSDYESTAACFDRLLLLFKVKEIVESKQVTWLVNILGVKTYIFVRMLIMPVEPNTKNMEEMTKVLKQHYKPQHPWECIHVDIARSFLYKMFMVVMDAH